jgi:hypothetical protein
MERNHRLDVGPQSFAPIASTDVLVVVHLDRDRHQIGEGIGQVLGQIGGLIHGCGIVSPSRIQWEEENRCCQEENNCHPFFSHTLTFCLSRRRV